MEFNSKSFVRFSDREKKKKKQNEILFCLNLQIRFDEDSCLFDREGICEGLKALVGVEN